MAAAFPVSFVFLEPHIDTGSTDDNQSETMDFGDEPGAGQTRLLVISAGTTGVTGIGSVTIGGVNATVIGPAEDGGTFHFLAYAEVPTGTSGTVAFSWEGGPTVDTGIGIWAIYNVDPTPFDTATDDGASNLDLSLNVPANGVTIAGTFCSNGGETTYAALSNKDFDVDVSTTAEEHSGASDLFVAAQTPLSLTADNAVATPDENAGVAASWGA